MIRTKLSKVKEIRTPHGKKVRWLISKEMGAPRFEMRHFTITDESQPQKRLIPGNIRFTFFQEKESLKVEILKSRSNRGCYLYCS